MLSDHCQQMLSAYVDGELSPSQREAVDRLLRKSPEARAYLRQLQGDSDEIRALPAHVLNPDFPQRVLRTIAERNIQPARPPAPPARPLPVKPILPAWAGFAAAAAVLCVIAGGSYLVFSKLAHQPDTGQVVEQTNPKDSAQTPHKDNNRPPRKPKDDPEPIDLQPDDPMKKPGGGAVEVPPKDRPEDPKPPEDSEPDLSTRITAPVPKQEMFEKRLPMIALPEVFAVANLDQPKFQKYLSQDSGFRLELPCRESVKSFDRVHGVLKAQGVTLLIEPRAQFRLQHKQLHTHFALYTENLTPDEVLKVVLQLGAEDKTAESKKKGDGQFESLVVSRMADEDRKELGSLLGINADQLGPRVAGPLGVDPRKPLSDQTLAQLDKALPGPKTPEKLAIVLPYNPVRPNVNSAEIKRFLESRKQQRPGAIQLLLVLRENERKN